MEGDPPSLVGEHARDPARPAGAPSLRKAKPKLRSLREKRAGLPGRHPWAAAPLPAWPSDADLGEAPGEARPGRGANGQGGARGEPRPGPVRSLSPAGTRCTWRLRKQSARPHCCPPDSGAERRALGLERPLQLQGSVSSAVDGSGVTPAAVWVAGRAGVEQRRAGTRLASPAASACARDQERVASALPAPRIGRRLLNAAREVPRAGARAHGAARLPPPHARAGLGGWRGCPMPGGTLPSERGERPGELKQRDFSSTG